MSYYGIRNKEEQKYDEYNNEVQKQNGNENLAWGVGLKPKKKNVPGREWDLFGDGGKTVYTGKAYFGTNFIEPGPEVDPFTLN